MKKIVPNQIIFEEVTRILNEGRQAIFTPKGNSMRPFIESGNDSVILVKSETYNKGEAVLALIGGKYILHRIIKVDGNIISMMGDGNLRGTEQCKMTAIIGKVTTIVSGNKTRNCDSHIQKFKYTMWQQLLPLRRYLLYAYRKLYLNLRN